MISLKDIHVVYDKITPALRGVSLDFHDGEFVGIIGLSGSGKSTLLKTINGLVKPMKGKVCLDELVLGDLSGKKLREVRRNIGFVFQEFNLVERTSVLENVLIGRLGYLSTLKGFFGLFKDSDYEIAVAALDTVGLKTKTTARAGQLSGGQKQRVAIAKTLTQEPRVILADEPVASLDRTSSTVVMDTFAKIRHKHKITIIINLHDVELARKYCDRLVGLRDGKVLFDKTTKEISNEDIQELYS